MKLPKIPDATQDAEAPKSMWDKIVTSTPVVMTVLATLLAGLSSSESNQAQYYRSLSAQNQSKAGDQWNFFQAKKLRSANATSAVKLLRNLGDVGSFRTDTVASAASHLIQNLKANPAGTTLATELKTQTDSLLSDPDVKKAMELLTSSLPPLAAFEIPDAVTRKAYDVLQKNDGDSTPNSVFGAVKNESLADSLRAADQNARTNDAELQPAIAGMAKIESFLDRLASISVTLRRTSSTQAATTQPSTTHTTYAATDREAPGEFRQLAADFSLAELRFEAARQDREARLNQRSAYLYEVAVRKTSWQSDRSLTRSRYFFYGMLGAQAAVLIATFSLAVRERSWMWSLAATIGVIAMAYAAYVYLYT